jgi:hypothetical protein
VNWEAISAIGQIVGALAVVISLIYLAREVRRNTRASRLTAMRSMSDAFNRWVQQLAVHPHLTEVFYRGIHDFQSLEGVDLVRFSTLMTQAFRNSEENFYLQLEGHLDPRVWRGWEKTIHDFLGYPGVQAWWPTRSHLYSEEFAKFINQLQQTAKPPRWYREPNPDQ